VNGLDGALISDYVARVLIGVNQLGTLLSVVIIDVVLAGDNAIVVGMAAAGLPAERRRRVIVLGIAAATVLRILFAYFAVQLLAVIGLTLAGGVLLLWVSWKLWREIAAGSRRGAAQGASKSFGAALRQIVIADVSMSLDNALAVAGAALEHPMILAAGLVISVLLMGLGAALLARLLQRYHWIAYLGLLVIVYVALHMIWTGGREIMAAVR